MSVFPPGPWKKIGDGRHLVDAYGDYVCDIKLDEEDPVVIATGNLIVAAPAMYETLEAVAAMLKRHRFHYSADGVLDVLAYARGEITDLADAAMRRIRQASAIEARRATDAKGGVVEDESAVGEAETPDSQTNPQSPHQQERAGGVTASGDTQDGD